MPRRLHLIRHADVIVEKNRRAIDWSLSHHAEESVLGLLDRFDPSHLRRILSSRETKALQTANILANVLNLPIDARQGLEEHHRSQNDFLEAAAFRDVVADFFTRPNERVFGEESANASLKRFDAAIRMIMDETDDDELIISHGRVISLFLASQQNSDPIEIWSSLKLPDHIMIEWPGLPALISELGHEHVSGLSERSLSAVNRALIGVGETGLEAPETVTHKKRLGSKQK